MSDHTTILNEVREYIMCHAAFDGECDDVYEGDEHDNRRLTVKFPTQMFNRKAFGIIESAVSLFEAQHGVPLHWSGFVVGNERVFINITILEE